MIETQGKANQRRGADVVSRHGHLPLPMAELIEQSRTAFDGKRQTNRILGESGI
jgi:hypothetical protein